MGAFVNFRGMLYDRLDNSANLANLGLSNFRSCREDENPAAEFLCFREQQASVWEIRTVGLHTVTARVKVAPREHIFRMQDLDEVIAIDTDPILINFEIVV